MSATKFHTHTGLNITTQIQYIGFYSALLHVSAVYISHHQMGIGSQGIFRYSLCHLLLRRLVHRLALFDFTLQFYV